MESLTADPDTQVEVDLMILDYLLCMAIDQVLSPGNGGETQYAHECDISWSLKTINTIKAALLPSYILPKDMQIKTQILELAQLFSDGNGHPEPSRRPAVEPSQGDQRTTTENRSPIAQSERRPPQLHQSHENDKPPAHNSRDLALNRSYNTLVRFIALCGTAGDNLPDGHADTTAKLITEAALNDYHMAGAQSPGRYRECIEHVTACLREDLDPHVDQANLEYLSTLLPPIDLLLDVSEGSGQTSSLGDTTTRLVHRFLTDLMKTLDPPILIQLERGRLGGLSREETQQLKDRIGF